MVASIPARLRCLEVRAVREPSELAHLGWLLANATQLTQLVLRCNEGLEFSCDALLQPLGFPAQAAAAAAAAVAAPAAPAGRLPPLRHLAVDGCFHGLLSTWLACPQAAAQLTCLHLTEGGAAAAAGEVAGLSACSGLRELVVDGYTPVALPADLTRLTGLTQLGLRSWEWALVPLVVWDLTTLHTLHVDLLYDNVRVPSSISNLQQLRALSMRLTGMEELPADLGTWLPHLEELDVSLNPIQALPLGLTRLTRLVAQDTAITQVSSLQHLVALRELRGVQLECGGSHPQSSLQPLTRLSALEALSLCWVEGVSGHSARGQAAAQDGDRVCVLPPLPALRSLVLAGPAWMCSS
jgi:Leucine-rich repeat (LRR) protein